MKNHRDIKVDPTFYDVLSKARQEFGLTFREQTRLIGNALTRCTKEELGTLYQYRGIRRPLRRRGQLEVATFPIWLVIVVIAVIVAAFVAAGLKTAFSSPGMRNVMPSDVQDNIVHGFDVFPKVMDFLLVGGAIVLILVSAWVSAQIPTAPQYMLLLLPFLLLGTVFSIFIGNWWSDLSTNSSAEMVAKIHEMPGINFLLNHLLEYTLFAIFVSGITYYSATKSQGGAGGAF
jgi:hypothetical protein